MIRGSRFSQIERSGPVFLVGVLVAVFAPPTGKANRDGGTGSDGVPLRFQMEPPLTQVESARRDVGAALTLWNGPHVSLDIYRQVAVLVQGAEEILDSHPAPAYELVLARSLGAVVDGTIQDLSASYQFRLVRARQIGDRPGEELASAALLQLHPDPADPIHVKVVGGGPAPTLEWRGER